MKEKIFLNRLYSQYSYPILGIYDGKIIIFTTPTNIYYAFFNIQLRFFVTKEKLLFNRLYSQYLYPFLGILDGKIIIF